MSNGQPIRLGWGWSIFVYILVILASVAGCVAAIVLAAQNTLAPGAAAFIFGGSFGFLVLAIVGLAIGWRLIISFAARVSSSGGRISGEVHVFLFVPWWLWLVTIGSGGLSGLVFWLIARA